MIFGEFERDQENKEQRKKMKKEARPREIDSKKETEQLRERD